MMTGMMQKKVCHWFLAGWMNGWMIDVHGWMRGNIWIDGWMNSLWLEWMELWMDGRMGYRWMDD